MSDERHPETALEWQSSGEASAAKIHVGVFMRFCFGCGQESDGSLLCANCARIREALS